MRWEAVILIVIADYGRVLMAKCCLLCGRKQGFVFVADLIEERMMAMALIWYGIHGI